LDLHDVKDFYLQATAGSADNDPTLPSSQKASFNATYSVADITPQTPNVSLNIYKGLDTEENLKKDFVMFVHGLRMRDYEITSFIETGFKRLYWSGYKGAYGGFSWPTGWFYLPAHEYARSEKLPKLLPNLENYNTSEAVARRVGSKFATWFNGLNTTYGNTHLIAHSMGNVVVSEALRAYAQQNPNTNLVASYTAGEAAVVAGAYDQNSQLIMEHKLPPLSFLPDWILTECVAGDPVKGIVLGPELSWRCYNSDNDGDYDMPPDLYRSDYFDNTLMEIRHGATTGNAMFSPQGNAYYASNSSAAGRILNYHNAGDAALNVWELNQLTKPDNTVSGGALWKYNNVIKNKAICENILQIPDCDNELLNETIPQDGIVTSLFKVTDITGLITSNPFISNDLKWGNGIAQDNQIAEILGHIIPARAQAMGQVAITIPGNTALDPNQQLGFTNSNQDHSAQFHGYYAEPSPIPGRGPVRANFWNRVLGQSLELDPLSDSDLSGLKNNLIVTTGQQ
jgi:hypothetical protein